MRRPGETDARRRLEDGTAAIPQPLRTSHDAEREARKNVIERMTTAEFKAFYLSCAAAGARSGLRFCDSDGERLSLIRDMTKGYCLCCGGVIGNDGRCTPGCP